MFESSTTCLLSLEQFEERLLDGERWVELIDGHVLSLNPPDDAHGDVVRNLAQALAAYLKRSTDLYACFEMPLIVRQEPPTVRCPAVSCFQFQEGGRFAETDKVITDTVPVLVIEVASSNERRQGMSERIRSYQQRGVTAVWVVDTVSQQVHIFHGQNDPRMLKEPQVLLGHPVLTGFSMPVGDLFRQPDWMKTRKQPTDF